MVRLVSEISSRIFGTRVWQDEILIVSPRLGGRNTNFNPGIETLVVEILIVSPRLGGRNLIFNRGNETLESRLWRACPVPGLFPVPGLCRLSGCFLNVYSITSWFVIICYFIFCSTALYYNMLFVIYYVLRMCFFYFMSCYISLRKFWLLCYVMVSILLCFALFGYVLLDVISFGSIILCYALVCYTIFPYTEKSLVKGFLVKGSLIHWNPLITETLCKGKSLTYTEQYLYMEISYKEIP